MQGPGAADGRLRNPRLPAAELEKLRRGERASTHHRRASPAAGRWSRRWPSRACVTSPDETLFRIVDTSVMWVLAEVYEQDLAFVKVGDMAKVVVNTWPRSLFHGQGDLHLSLDRQGNRTARLRIEVANPDGLLRADMAATVEIDAPIAGPVGWRPPTRRSSTPASGRLLLVERGEGKYEPRP